MYLFTVGDEVECNSTHKDYRVIDRYLNSAQCPCYMLKDIECLDAAPKPINQKDLFSNYILQKYKKVSENKSINRKMKPKEINNNIYIRVDVDNTEAYIKLEQIERKLIDIKRLQDEVFNG